MKHPFRLLLAGLMSIACAGSLLAETNYVDAVNGSDANNGQTPATAFLTLQVAVDAAVEGDVVLAAPGVYDQGGRADISSGDPLTNRVCIDKGLTLRASAGPAQTLIVGRRGTGETPRPRSHTGSKKTPPRSL